jgi:hypothetical protein
MDEEELKGLLPQEVVEEPAPAAPAEPPAAEPATPGPARGPDGKFAAKETPAAAEPAPTPPPAPEPGHVPISAMLDEREKRQALERQLAELKARQEPPKPLEPTEQLQQALYTQNLRASRKFAEREYGKEQIEAVHKWAAEKCDSDPIFNQQMLSSEDPYEAAYQAYNREQIVAKVSPDRLAAFEAWEKAQAEAQAAAPIHTPSTAAPPPPKSLATAPGNGAAGAPHIPVGEGEAFRAAIPH